jgi:hypothetical protein
LSTGIRTSIGRNIENRDHVVRGHRTDLPGGSVGREIQSEYVPRCDLHEEHVFWTIHRRNRRLRCVRRGSVARRRRDFRPGIGDRGRDRHGRAAADEAEEEEERAHEVHL